MGEERSGEVLDTISVAVRATAGGRKNERKPIFGGSEALVLARG